MASNNNFKATLSPAEAAKLAFLRAHVKHVIYIVKENRTYDQVLGDLEVGNGDPSLTEFPEATTPNFHQLARELRHPRQFLLHQRSQFRRLVLVYFRAFA